MEVSTEGLDNLTLLKDQSCILAANHLKPTGTLAEQSGLSPDAFILAKIIKEQTGKELSIVQKSDDGWWSNKKLIKFLQKNIGQPFGKGFVRGIGNIPVQKNPGSFNRDFIESIKISKEHGDPILIFPEGAWYPDFNPENELKTGTSHISLKYDLPIIPVYINGIHDWTPDQSVQVSFGEPIHSSDRDKEEITQELKNKISRLQKEFNKNK